MTIQDDETLQMYLEESLEHLADIENDLLNIEADGADINEDLVNKVYRAAHSIKGGAGFMGLTHIKDLTHEMENILGKIRSRDMVPTPEIINVLLMASDALKDLMDNVLNSNEMDISEHVEKLKAIAEGKLPEPLQEPAATAKPAEVETADTPGANAPVDPLTEGVLRLSFEGGTPFLDIPADQVTPVLKDGKCVYLVQIHVADDIQAKDKTCQSVMAEMDQTGIIIGTNFEYSSVGELDKDWVPDVDVMVVIFGTILKPGDINVLFDIADAHILEVMQNLKLRRLDGSIIDQEGAAAAPEPQPAHQPIDPEPKVSETTEQTSMALSTAPEVPVEPVPVSEPNPAPIAEMKTNPVAAASVPGADAKTPAEVGSAPKVAKVEHETSLRVHVSLLDQLMTLAGELVLSRNQLLQSMGSSDQRGSETAGQRIDLITSELQEAIMLTRMQSIGNVFNKFPRVVRDLARTLGKQVELTLEGKEVELDKTIIEAIGDPLTHLVRNAVDHGIELPDLRRSTGKNPVGQIYLKAYHEAGQVNIEISDDGKGLDGGRLAAKAVEKGLISDEQAKVMSDREKIGLIFLPGFSTAEKITDVSGRGVGMDVVKTNLDKLGGIIDIDSEQGKGSTIRIKLPLTLAIIPCQIVLTGGERYAIPQVNLEELLRIPADQVRSRIERVGNADVVRLRGNLLPLIRLANVIDIEPVYTDPETGAEKLDRRVALADRRSRKSPLIAPEHADDYANAESITSENDLQPRDIAERRYHAASALNIVVVSTGAMKYGLVVDDLHDSEEIVVKPLGRDLKKCKGYAGATIMGDGRVALILDVSNLAQMAGLTSLEGSARAEEIAQAEREALRARKDKQSLLIFRSAEDEQFAAPLNLVERIEKIKISDIEQVGGKRVMKYRGGSLPLFSIDEVAMVKPLADSDNLLVIVFVVGGREVGLLAMGPVDAMETSLDVDGATLKQPGIMGSAIINDHTTLLIDIFDVVQTLNPEWFETHDAPEDASGESATILFAEDSSFFRNQVKGSMEEEGYTVLEAEDGIIAWDLLQENADSISIVVTDIEMPNMDGFALTKRIKENPVFSHLPVIALTTLAGEEDVARGKEVGIDDYQIKLDREKLMQSIFSFLKAA